MDGDSFGERYEQLTLNGLERGYDGVRYKDAAVYRGDKIFVRQAGVGLSVAYHGGTAYCPQSVYVYEIRDDRDAIVSWNGAGADSWTGAGADSWADPDIVPDPVETEPFHKFLVGVLNSRLCHYYVFKRFGEIDAAQAFAKLTQTQIRSLPIPIEKLATETGRETASEIAHRVDELRDGDAEFGSETDWEIERLLCDLYGVSSETMEYVTKQLGLAAYHKAMRELYPDGRPPKPDRKTELSVSID